MTTKLTKAEKEYIVALFADEVPEVKRWKDISEMPAGMLDLFIDNKSVAEQTGEDCGLDKSITEKFLHYHKLPLDTTYHDYVSELQYTIADRERATL